MDLGRAGVWTYELRDENRNTAGELGDAAAELEECGYGTIWLGGSPAVRHARTLLAATSRIVVATGILSIWEHDPAEVAAEQAALAEEYPGRFLLGLGASHSVLVENYAKPYSKMVEYLDGLDAAGAPASGRVLAALRPRMLALSRDRAAGAHPYVITTEHTAKAREILGPGPILAPEVKVVLEADPGRARAAARDHLGFYLTLPNYAGNLRQLGYTEEDFQDGGSDRLIDAVFAWGDMEAIRDRVQAHHDAGADQAVLQVIGARSGPPPRAQWRELAAGLGLDRP